MIRTIFEVSGTSTHGRADRGKCDAVAYIGDAIQCLPVN
jgi:hypothetical protein